MYNADQAKNAGSNYTIKIELCDDSGANISDRKITLTALTITREDGTIYDPGKNDSGNANGGNNDLFEFRYSNRDGYVYNLDTSLLTAPGAVPGPGTRFTLDFEAQGVTSDGTPVSGIGHAPFTLDP